MKFNQFNSILRNKADEFGTGGGGGTAMPEAEFQQKTLGAVQAMRTQQETLLKNYDNLDKTTKSAVEELTKVKNQFDGLDSSVKGFEQALKKVNLALALESRMAAGGNTLSLGQRVARRPDDAKQVFALIARAIGNHDAAKKALGEDAGFGSNLIRPEMVTEIYDSLMRYGAWATLGVRPMGARDAKIPVKTARAVANFILTEGGAIADDTNKAGTTVTLEAELVGVLLNVSLQLIEDGEVDVVADVLDDFIEAINFRCDYAAFSGSGAADATNGGVTGLFNFGTAATAAATRTTIAATKYEDWLKCLTSIDAAVLTRPARWWIHPSLIAAAIAVQDGNGRPVFQTALEAPQGGGLLNLFGFPVTAVGAAPSTNAASAKVAAFGDPRAFAVGMRRQFAFDASDHAAFSAFQRSFRGSCRFDAVGARATALTVLTLPAA